MMREKRSEAPLRRDAIMGEPITVRHYKTALSAPLEILRSCAHIETYIPISIGMIPRVNAFPKVIAERWDATRSFITIFNKRKCQTDCKHCKDEDVSRTIGISDLLVGSEEEHGPVVETLPEGRIL